MDIGLNDNIELINGLTRLTFNLEPNASIIIDPNVLNHMDGRLILEPTVFSKGGISAGLKRSIAGESIINEQITNKTNDKLKISLSSQLLGVINKLEILPNQIWRFTPSSFIACTSNILVSGNIDIFSNFKAYLAGQNILYTEVSTIDGKPGKIWISSHGILEKHEIEMGMNTQKLLINDGAFLGMLSEDMGKKINYWDRFVSVRSANGFFKGLLTKKSFLMNIEDKKRNAENNTKCIIYTQSLNIRNLQNYVQSITQSNNTGFSFFGGSNYNKLQKYESKLINL